MRSYFRRTIAGLLALLMLLAQVPATGLRALAEQSVIDYSDPVQLPWSVTPQTPQDKPAAAYLMGGTDLGTVVYSAIAGTYLPSGERPTAAVKAVTAAAQAAADARAAEAGLYGRVLSQFSLGLSDSAWTLEGQVRVTVNLDQPIPVYTGESLSLVRLTAGGEAVSVNANISNRRGGVAAFSFTADALGEYALLGVSDVQPESYTVTFQGMDGAVIEARTVANGAPVGAFPAAPEVEGYTFASWIGAEGEAIDENTPVTADLTVIASYSEDYPATVADAAAGDVTVHVDVPAGALPADARFRMLAVNSEDYRAAVENALESRVGVIKAVDMAFVSPNGEEYHPLKPVAVHVTVSGLEDADSLSVVHILDNGVGEVVAEGITGSSFSFEAADFSVYTVSSPSGTLDIRVVDEKNNGIGDDYNVSVSDEEEFNLAANAPEIAGYEYVKATISSISGTPIQRIRLHRVWNIWRWQWQWQYSTQASGNNSWSNLDSTVYYVYKDLNVKITFNANGGNQPAPETMSGLPGDTMILPDYSGVRNGYTFLGWSTGKNLVSSDYYPLYKVGSAYTIPDKDTTLYAVWSSNTAASAEFYLRLDGTIPYEPGQYGADAYTSKITITGAITKQVWVIDINQSKPNNGLNVVNDVTATLKQVPTAAQLVNNINGSSSKLGFTVKQENGAVVVDRITNASLNSGRYNVSVGDGLYVLWYVQKKTSSAWHVDGVLLVKDKVNIAYDGNAADGKVTNVPVGYQETKGTDVVIGASGSKNGQVRTPVRPGYNFLGWNTSPDGTGTAFSNNDIYTLNEDTTLFAQWSKGTNYMTVTKTNEDGEVLKGARFTLEEKKDSGSWVTKANRETNENGIFTYDTMENQTIYRLTETYAPNGYEVQNSFCFLVTTKSDSSSILDLCVCDENGNRIAAPDWLAITYTPADAAGGNGVAQIRFNIKDERIQRNIRFIKVDESGNPLAGAVYTLTDGKNKTVNGVLTSASAANGVFSVSDATLPYGSYTLTETKAPETYAISEPVTFTLNDYSNAQNTGLRITGGSATAECQVSETTVEGLTIITYSYTVTVSDEPQNYIRVNKSVQATDDLLLSDINMTVYYALTKDGGSSYLEKNGSIWLKSIEIRNGVPSPSYVLFDGVEDIGKYEVWELALIDGQYTRMYNGLTFGNAFQVSSIAANNDSGKGNNAVITATKRGATVNFTNTYSAKTETTDFVVNKRWWDRSGQTVTPPDGAVIEFTLYAKGSDGSLREVRSIELDGQADPDGEFEAWTATFKYLPITDASGAAYEYKVKETVTVDDFYPNNYPAEFYVTSSGGTITNTQLLTDIVIRKHVELQPAAEGLLRNAAAGLTFTLTNTTTNQTWTYTLANFDNIGEEATDYHLTLTNMPIGSYTLTESGQENLLSAQGYDLVYSVTAAEGTAAISGTSTPTLDTLRLQNIYAKHGTLAVTKTDVQTQNATAADQAMFDAKKFTFLVKYGDLYLQGDSSLGATPYEFELAKGETKTFDNAPTGEYVVIEKDAAVDRYTWTEESGSTPEADGSRSKAATVAANQTSTVGYTNRYEKILQGNIRVNKVVSGGPAEAAAQTYTVKITTQADGVTRWLTADGTLSGTETALNLTQADALEITNVPVGDYTITEVTDDVQFEKYNLNVAYAPATVTVTDGSTAVSTVTNTYTLKEATVNVSKAVSGASGEKDYYFGFDVTLTDADGNRITDLPGMTGNGILHFNLNDGASHSLTGLPVGATVTILEHNEDYTTTVSGTSGGAALSGTTAEDDGTVTYSFVVPEAGAEVVFNNSRYDIVVVKTFEGLSREELPAGFAIGYASGSEISGELKLTGGDIDPVVTGEDDTTVYTWTLKNVENNAAYTFTESGYEVAGYKVTASAVSQTVTVGADASRNRAEFTNTYERGTLTITKTASGADVPANTTFTVKSGDTTYAAFSYSDMTDGVYTLNHVPLGATYTVEESGAEVAGYTLVTSYGKEAALSQETLTGSLTVDNAYHKLTDVTVTKTFAGDMKAIHLPGNFSIAYSYTPVGSTEAKTGTLALSAGEASDDRLTYTWTLPEQVPADTVITFTESNYSHTYTRDGHTFSFYSDPTTSAGGVSGRTEGTLTVQADGSNTFAFVNTYERKYVTVTIRKTVSGNMGDPDQKFTFHFTASEESGSTEPLMDQTSQLSHGGEWVVAQVPAGSRIVIEESDAEGYVTTIDDPNTTEENRTTARTQAAFQVTDQDAAVTFNNDRTVVIDTGITDDLSPYLLLLGLIPLAVAVLLAGSRRRRRSMVM